MYLYIEVKVKTQGQEPGRLSGNWTVLILPPSSLILSACLLLYSSYQMEFFSLFSAHTREDSHSTVSEFIFLFKEISWTEQKSLRSNPRFLAECH